MMMMMMTVQDMTFTVGATFDTKADIKAELDDATAKADAEIAAKAAEGEKKIGEIRASAMESVQEVAEATAQELVAAMGIKASDKTISDAVQSRVKG